MIKKIVPFLLLLLTLFTFSVSPTFAAISPTTTIWTSADRHFAYLSFSNLKNVSKVSYTLTYATGTRTTGVEGGFKVSKSLTKTTRRQILGTCSTKFCTYHKNPKNLTLTVTYYLRSGGTTTTVKNLP